MTDRANIVFLDYGAQGVAVGGVEEGEGPGRFEFRRRRRLPSGGDDSVGAKLLPQYGRQIGADLPDRADNQRAPHRFSLPRCPTTQMP